MDNIISIVVSVVVSSTKVQSDVKLLLKWEFFRKNWPTAAHPITDCSAKVRISWRMEVLILHVSCFTSSCRCFAFPSGDSMWEFKSFRRHEKLQPEIGQFVSTNKHCVWCWVFHSSRPPIQLHWWRLLLQRGWNNWYSRRRLLSLLSFLWTRIFILAVNLHAVVQSLYRFVGQDVALMIKKLIDSFLRSHQVRATRRAVRGAVMAKCPRVQTIFTERMTTRTRSRILQNVQANGANKFLVYLLWGYKHCGGKAHCECYIYI